MIDLTQIYLRYKEEHDLAIQQVVQNGKYIQGEQVNIFASELSKYLTNNTNNNIVCSCANGSDALLIAYKTLGLKVGDEVIMPSHNYIASAESAIRLGLVPIIADTNPNEEYIFSINSNNEYLDSISTKKTKAIVMVNMYGMPCDTDNLKKFCKEKNIFLIEDNAQGMGGHADIRQQKTKLSLHGDIATTSFFPTKPLGAMGDGGAIITKNIDWINKAKEISLHGQHSKYQYETIGMNSRLDTLQATILRVRLSHLDDIIDSYNNIAQSYQENIPSNFVIKPKKPQNSRPTFYQYTIVLDEGIDRTKLMKKLYEKGLQTAVYYPQIISDIECYKKYCITKCNLSNTNDIKNRILSLPIYPFMPIEQAEKNADIFINTLKKI